MHQCRGKAGITNNILLQAQLSGSAVKFIITTVYKYVDYKIINTLITRL